MKPCNVLLVQPSPMPGPEVDRYLRKETLLRTPRCNMPLAGMLLGASIRKAHPDANIQLLDIGINLYLHDTREASTLDAFLDAQLDTVVHPPDVVGISVSFSTSHTSSLLLAGKIKRRWSGAVVVLGGNHATNYADRLLEDPNIALVVRGPGEQSLCELVANLRAGRDPAAIQGVIDRRKVAEGAMELSRFSENLDDLPRPAYDLVNMAAYEQLGTASILFSRGCVFQCSFCCCRTPYPKRKVYTKSNQRIIEEIREINDNYQFKDFMVCDDLFPSNRTQFLELVREIKRLGLHFKFSVLQGFSVVILNEEIIDNLVDLGIDTFVMPIESGSPMLLKNVIRKLVDFKKVHRLIRYMRAHPGVNTIGCNLILGFPGETREIMQETIDLANTIDVDWVYIYPAIPLPGSELLRRLDQDGIVDADLLDFDRFRLGLRAYDAPEVGAKELEEIVYDCNISCNFFNNRNLLNHRYAKAEESFSYILGNYPFHVVARYCRGLARQGLGQEESAREDLRETASWIRRDPESARLYARYGERMPLVRPYLTGEDNHAAK